jgi:hypothetical protein
MRLSYFVRKASKDAVIEGVKNIKRYYLAHQKIVSNKNPLITNGINAIFNHANALKTYRIKQSKINSFLAASSLSHLLDGWMYLSNSFSAMLNGDKGTAVHLGYYAELRSAMSILATEGIGVFDQKHIGAFSPVANCEYPKNYYKGVAPNLAYKQPEIRTHVFVWDAMDKWANSAFKPDSTILQIFKVRDKNFYDLTEYFHSTTAVSTLLSVQTVKSWLKEWCFDIKSYRNDRENRNEVSYRPQRIKDFNQNINFQTIINELDSFWNVISPIGPDKFSLLDTYLLRKLYNGLYTSIGTTVLRKDLIQNAFNQFGIHDSTLFDFLDFQPPYNNDHVIFNYANSKQTTPLSIIARATLLLRVSVGLVSQLYNAGGISKNQLDFIWDNYGIDCGFWVTGNLPTDFNNLWSDIQPSLTDLRTDINSPGIDNSIYSIRQRNTEEIDYLCQINRACLWGLDF